MSVIKFACPHCAAALRIPDHSYIGKRVSCPDCKQPLQIMLEDDQVTAISVDDLEPPHDPDVFSLDDLEIAPEEIRPAKATLPPPVHKSQRKPARKVSAAPFPVSRQIPPPVPPPTAVPEADEEEFVPVRPPGLFSTLPQRVAWGVALVLLGGLIGFIASRPTHAPPVEEPVADHPVEPDAEVPVDPAETDVISEPEGPAVATFESRLRNLETRLKAYLESEGRFPSGTWGDPDLAVTDRLSWLAELEERNEPAPSPPHRDRSWRDPLNDRFVRRRIAAYQNPDVPELIGADGYPAGHFVGIAGVGRDAARLSKDHARAGIFGDERKTSVTDVRDGLANTMLVAGISRELGAWAAGGFPTVRGFTREPYVNGPDGFGSGQPDSMLVLMADGSVRTISASTDPRLVRRMAAMADGLPLDVSVAGEPGETFATPPTPAPVPVAQNPPPKLPGETGTETPDSPAPKPPPEPEPIDIAGLLAVRIVRFEQAKPAPLSRLLLQAEELIGVPIRVDRAELGPLAANLENEIRVDRTDVTLKDLLTGMLEETGLTYRIERVHIQIVPAEVTGTKTDEANPPPKVVP